jgi:hypothetical protein
MTDPDELDRGERDAEAEAEAASGAASDAATDVATDARELPDNDELADPLTTNDYSVAFTPRNVAVGLAIVAGLVAVVAARRRGSHRGEDD